MNAAKKFSRQQLDAARVSAEKRFANRSTVTGVDVGYKWTEGKPTKELCVRVHVREKIPLSALEAADIFPETIDGVPLDVIQGHYQIRRATQPSEHSARFPILFGGISVAHKDVSAGTIGTMVIDNLDGRPGLLSNWHVLAGATGRPGDDILQPGPFDGGVAPQDSVATLGRSILDSDGDAAVAFFNGSRPWLPFIFGGFDHPIGVRDSTLGETLKKSGRTTAQTSARVDGEGRYFIAYEVRPGTFERIGVLGFKLVSETQGNPNDDELSSGGDSGALWYNPNSREAVGLHFAGETDPNPMAEHAIACNMTNVTRKLNVRLATAEDLLGAFSTPHSGGVPAAQAEAALGSGWQGSGISVGNQPANTDLSFPPDGPRWPPHWPGWPHTGPVWPPFGPGWPPFPPHPPFCPQCGVKANADIRNTRQQVQSNTSSAERVIGRKSEFNETTTEALSIPLQISKYALNRNHGIAPGHVRLHHQLRATYGLQEGDLRALDVPINDKLQEHGGGFVTADDCQRCEQVADLVVLIGAKL